MPVSIVLSEVRFVLHERSCRKHAFLNRAICETGLAGRVVASERSFPEGFSLETPMVFTTRAIEQPGYIQNMLARLMPPGSVFLCQGRLSPVFEGPMFYVEHVTGDWPWRRGILTVVRRI